MKITADTNILVRAIVDDDAAQSLHARSLLDSAELVAVTLPMLCELVWVLRHAYKIDRVEIGRVLRTLLNAENVKSDHAAVEAGIAFLNAGGDFADGIIAHEGAWLGGGTFVSFDTKAVRIAREQGLDASTPE